MARQISALVSRSRVLKPGSMRCLARSPLRPAEPECFQIAHGQRRLARWPPRRAAKKIKLGVGIWNSCYCPTLSAGGTGLLYLRRSPKCMKQATQRGFGGLSNSRRLGRVLVIQGPSPCPFPLRRERGNDFSFRIGYPSSMPKREEPCGHSRFIAFTLGAKDVCWEMSSCLVATSGPEALFRWPAE